MLVRDETDGLEVCMLRRHLDSDFVGGAYVFPGGKVDEDDRSELAQTVCAGRTDEQASELLGVESGGLAFFVAALRECFEEAGILLAYPAGATGGDLYRPQDVEAESRLARFRAEVNARRVGFLEACESAQACVSPSTGSCTSRTGSLPSRRPSGSTRASSWRASHPGRPRSTTTTRRSRRYGSGREALDRNDAGEFDLIFPTVKNLQAISTVHDVR